MDQAYGVLGISIYLDLLFHITSIATPNVVWTKLEGLFGKHDVMRGDQLEIELINSNMRTFDTIRDFSTKLKSLLLQLELCGIDMKQQNSGKKTQEQKEQNPRSTQETPNSNVGKTKKDKMIFTYYKKPNHK